MRSVADAIDPNFVTIFALSLFAFFGWTTWSFVDAAHATPRQIDFALITEGKFRRVTVLKVEPTSVREHFVQRVARPECEAKVPEVHHAWHVPYYDIDDHRCGGWRPKPECFWGEYDLVNLL